MAPWKEKSNTRVSQRSERKGARQEGGQTTPMSGAGRKKGDYRSANFLTEVKDTAKDSYRLDAATWLKIEHEALTQRPIAMPKMRITMGSGRNKLVLHVLREKDLLGLIEMAGLQ